MEDDDVECLRSLNASRWKTILQSLGTTEFDKNSHCAHIEFSCSVGQLTHTGFKTTHTIILIWKVYLPRS